MDFTPGEISHEDTIGRIPESRSGLKKPSSFNRVTIELASRFEPTKESDFGDQSTELTVEAAKESEEPMNEALKNIHNLIHIRGSNILFVALADWERSEKAYRKRVHRKKKVLRNTRIEVITLTGFFSRSPRISSHGRSGIDFLTVHKSWFFVSCVWFGHVLRFGFRLP